MWERLERRRRRLSRVTLFVSVVVLAVAVFVLAEPYSAVGFLFGQRMELGRQYAVDEAWVVQLHQRAVILRMVGVGAVVAVLVALIYRYLSGGFSPIEPEDLSSEEPAWSPPVPQQTPAPQATPEFQVARSGSSFPVERQDLGPDTIRRRLLGEVRSLGRRAAINLAIGSGTTAVAVVILGYVAFTAPASVPNWQERLLPFVLRLSVAVFAQVFAFFFLRLYRSNLQEIKYFQNELTNIEARVLALEYSIKNPLRPEGAKLALAALARTERNHVLKKGETTLEIERARAEHQLETAIVTGVLDTLRAKGVLSGKTGKKTKS
jgi:hypothetical protein